MEEGKDMEISSSQVNSSEGVTLNSMVEKNQERDELLHGNVDSATRKTSSDLFEDSVLKRDEPLHESEPPHAATTRITSDDVKDAAASSDILPDNVATDDQEPWFDASPTAFAKSAKPAGIGMKKATGAHMYDPYTGIYIDPRSGYVTSLSDDNVEVDEELARKHAQATERLKKLQEPACDHSRLSARIKLHGSATCPYVGCAHPSVVESDRTGSSNTTDVNWRRNLDRVVTSGLTETADVSLNDMAACSLGTLYSHSEPVTATTTTVTGNLNSSKTGSGIDITDLPTTSTLLQKTHIIPEMVDRLEEEGIGVEILFSNVQVFNGMIIDRGLMAEAPQVRLLKKSGFVEGDAFLLVLIELKSSGPFHPSEAVSDYLQWMVEDIKAPAGAELDVMAIKGDQIVVYQQMPSSTKERHKHVLLLFHQNRKLMTIASRQNFDVHEFILRNNLGSPVAAVYFESEAC